MRAGDSAAFWTFSLDVYGRPGVREACLALQDEAGLDVNLLLYCLWRAARGVPLTEAELAARRDAAAPWTEAAIVPLRVLRRGLKTPPPRLPADAAKAIAARVGEIELAAERTAQELIVESAPEPAPEPAGASRGHDVPALAKAHLRLYARMSDCGPDRQEFGILAATLA